MPRTDLLSTAVTDLQGRLGLRCWVHARDLTSGATCGHDAEQSVVAASVFKLPVLLEVALQVHAGELDARAPITIPADHRRTAGGTGLSTMLDDVTLSLRDVVLSMMSVSDNRATDLVMDLVGVDRVNATLSRLGLPGTSVTLDCEALWNQLAEDVGAGDDADLAQPSPEVAERLARSRPLNPATTNRTTPAETTELLRAIWQADGIPQEAAAEVRRILGLQVWGHRLTTGFPDARVKLFAKTGTLGFVRNEVGVVEHPDGGRYAVAVFLQLDRADARQPDADRAIGTIGRAAVEELRAGPGPTL